jgi:hypothetical protein
MILPFQALGIASDSVRHPRSKVCETFGIPVNQLLEGIYEFHNPNEGFDLTSSLIVPHTMTETDCRLILGCIG